MQNKSFVSNLRKGVGKRLRGVFKNPYRKVGISWFRLKQLKHLPSGTLRTQDLFGKPLSFIDPPELLHGIREIFIDEIYKQQLKESPFIIDCGANIGLSVVYMKQLYPHARILAFEPDEKNFKLLEDNVRAFGYTGVELRKEAIWTQDTELHFTSSGSMSSRIGQSGGHETKVVQAIQLKKLLDKEVDFLKIDIEGAEYDVLKDVKDSLSGVKNLFVEYHGSFTQTGELTQIFQWLHEAGFSYYIKEAAPVFPTPFQRDNRIGFDYDVQLNIFGFRV